MRKRISQLAYYTIPSFFSKGVSLLLVPLYTRNLSVAEFGKLELILLFGLFLQYVFHFGWGSAYVRYYKEESITTADLIFTLLCFRLFIALCVALVIVLIGVDKLAIQITQIEQFWPAIVAIVVVYLAREFMLFFETKFRVEEMPLHFMWMSLGISFLQLLLIPTMLLRLNYGVTGIIWGQAISLLLVSAVLLSRNLHWMVKGRYDKELLKRILSFGLPLVPAAIAIFLVTGSDRYMLMWLLKGEHGVHQVAYYSLAYKFVMAMTLLSSGFSRFWGPYVYLTYKNSDAKLKYEFIYRNYILILFIASTSLILVLPWIYLWFQKYSDGLILVPVLLSGFLVYQVGDYLCIGIGIKKKTSIRAYAGAVTAIINITLNYLLIPKYSAMGAVFSTLFSYVLYVAILMYHSQKLYWVNFPWLQWVVAITTTAGFSFIYLYKEQFFNVYYCLVVVLVSLFYLRSGGFSKPWVKNRYGIEP